MYSIKNFYLVFFFLFATDFVELLLCNKINNLQIISCWKSSKVPFLVKSPTLS